jgi:hypothetical protein
LPWKNRQLASVASFSSRPETGGRGRRRPIVGRARFDTPWSSWFMIRKLTSLVLIVAMALGSAADVFARSPFQQPASRVPSVLGRGTAGGPLARLNRPLIPAMPGLPTVSPLGLVAPRLSMAVQFFQQGGLRSQTGRLAGLGILSPRISPVAAFAVKPPVTPQAQLMYGMTILSPRLAVLCGMLKAARGAVSGLPAIR